MSDIKEVTVAMSEADMKAFSRGTTRRRRVKRSAEESPVMMDPLVGGSSVAVVKGAAEIVSLPAPIAPPAAIIPVAAPVSVVAAPVSVVAPQPTMASVGGAIVAPTVKIQAKKSSMPLLLQTPSVVGGGPKILPTKKRISAAPAAHTLKKPRLVVATHVAPMPSGGTVTPPIATETPKQGVVSGIPKKKRRFTERKISIEVKSASATRKHHRKLKHKIESMSIGSVKKFLLSKGVLKPKADGKMPPEDMMRSMLKDYLLLHAAE